MKTFRINNVTICIPKGWHRVARGTVKDRDKYLNWETIRWELVGGWHPGFSAHDLYLIRKDSK